LWLNASNICSRNASGGRAAGAIAPASRTTDGKRLSARADARKPVQEIADRVEELPGKSRFYSNTLL
jgi:hypothetical protein